MLLYAHPEFSCKDACLAWADGLWHLFFSAFDDERSRVARLRSPDLKTFSDLEILFDGRDQGWIGMCSPDITRGPDGWVLVCNSWGMAPGRPNSLQLSTSPDLHQWSPLRSLAPDLVPCDRVIDGTLAWIGSRWMLACKWWKQCRFASSVSLDGPWHWIHEGPASLLAADTGNDNGLRHENFQLIQIDKVWHLLSTDYRPGEIDHHPWLYRMEGDPEDPRSWLRWTGGRRLQVPAEDWNALDPDNAASLLDHRAVDGRFYLLHAGRNEKNPGRFMGSASTEKPWPRGWNRLGLATSTNLHTWTST